jgi:hypothetical protein
MFFSFIAFILTKFVSPLGLSFLEPLLNFFNAREAAGVAKTGQFTTALQSALDAEVQSRRIASQERVALWGDTWYKLLIYLIVGPPAIYSGAVFADSVFNFDFVVNAAPARFEELGFGILMTFIGASGAVGAVSGLKGIWRK